MTPVFPDRLRLPLDFDPTRLAADMAAISAGSWIAHFVTQNYDGDWSVIPLRGPAGARHPVQMSYIPTRPARPTLTRRCWRRRLI